MAWGQNSTPVVPGQGQTADDRALFLKLFGGEVLTAYTASVLTRGKLRERSISAGKSAQFPMTGTAIAEYMQRGQEALGNTFATHEREVTIDGLLVSHYSVPDLDDAMAHFDIRGPIAQDMGQAIARADDQNAFRALVLAARTAPVGPAQGGDVLTDNAFTDALGSVDGKAWLDGIRRAKIAKRKKNVPAGTMYLAVAPEVFDGIKYATNAQGVFLLQNRDNAPVANLGFGSPTEVIRFEGVEIYSTNLLPNANDSANTNVWSKYRADFSKTKGIMWSPDAVARLQLLGMAVEKDRDVRRQEDFMIARLAVGYGTLRAECATEFRVV